jgi:hypothetical protein
LLLLGTTTLDFNMNDDNNNIMVTKQYHFNADITFECEFENVEAAYNADAPVSFDKYEVKNIRLINSLIKKKDKQDAESVCTSTESK